MDLLKHCGEWLYVPYCLVYEAAISKSVPASLTRRLWCLVCLSDIPVEKHLSVCVLIDKIDKISETQLIDALHLNGVAEDKARTLLSLVKVTIGMTRSSCS